MQGAQGGDRLGLGSTLGTRSPSHTSGGWLVVSPVEPRGCKRQSSPPSRGGPCGVTQGAGQGDSRASSPSSSCGGSVEGGCRRSGHATQPVLLPRRSAGVRRGLWGRGHCVFLGRDSRVLGPAVSSPGDRGRRTERKFETQISCLLRVVVIQPASSPGRTDRRTAVLRGGVCASSSGYGRAVRVWDTGAAVSVSRGLSVSACQAVHTQRPQQMP